MGVPKNIYIYIYWSGAGLSMIGKLLCSMYSRFGVQSSGWDSRIVE